MDIRRSITCGFWSDGWVESMNTEQKLLFLYMLTNPLSNILGIYKISLNRMSFETGINPDTILQYLKGFERLRKAYYIDEFVIIVNHIKHQALNPNMKINIVSDFNALPNELKDKINGNTSEGFKSLSKSLQTLPKIEIEIEREIEREKERGKLENAPPPTLKIVQLFFSQNGYNDAEKFFNTYSKNDWYDTKGNKILDWQQKAKDMWFKPDNKTQAYDISKINADSERLD